MITLKDSFGKFIDLCIERGACADPGEAIPVMEEANKGNGMTTDGTCEEGFSLYLKDEKFPEVWSPWVIENLGKELDEECRRYFIDKIKDPANAMKVMSSCSFLTENEMILLKEKYQGKIINSKEGVVVKYISVECYGKGFISPTDATNLKFENVSGTLWKVEGVETTVDTWIAKVSGTLIEKATAVSVRIG